MFPKSLAIVALMLAAAGAACGAELVKVAPGVYFRPGDLARGQCNGGYIVCDDGVIAIDAPNPEASAEMLAEAAKLSDKPLRYLVVTHGHWDHDGGIEPFVKKGVTLIVHESLRQRYAEKNSAPGCIGVADRIVLAQGGQVVELFTRGTTHSSTDLFTYLPKHGVLFCGDAVVSTQAAWLGECDLQNWIDTLGHLASLKPAAVCPGHGPNGGPELIADFAAYLTSLRDEVAFSVCQGRKLEAALAQVKVPASEKYTKPEGFADHVKAAWKQLTAPPPPRPDALPAAPRALAVIGDHYHPPAYIRPPLEAAFRKIGLPVTFLHDVSKLDAEALRGVRLLVVLRDGMIWPENDKDPAWWMSPEQEKLLSEFVRDGGGYLALHNSTALRMLGPDENAYREMLGCSYNGHGAGDEKFTVRVVDASHPVTRGVSEYTAVDERHNPTMHAKDATVLLEAVSGGQRSVNGYVRAFGRGRVCHLANGHNIEVLSQPAMQRLIGNAALWCCGLD